MSGFWELLVLDPGPRGPGASWEEPVTTATFKRRLSTVDLTQFVNF